MVDYLQDKIGPNEMAAICWLYATVKATDCKCYLWNGKTDKQKCTRCRSLEVARKAWPFTVAFIEGEK